MNFLYYQCAPSSFFWWDQGKTFQLVSMTRILPQLLISRVQKELWNVFSRKSTHGITSRDCKWGAYQEQGLGKVIKLHSSKHRKLFDRFCETTILKWLKWVLDSTKSISAVPKKHGFNWNVFKMIMLCNKVQLHNVLKATLSVCWPDKV